MVHDIEKLQIELAALPSGYISRKLINGKEHFYYQWREGKRVKSRYIKRNELETLQAALNRKAEIKEILKEHSFANRAAAYFNHSLLTGEISIGAQWFEKLIRNQCFYVDKTSFIFDWWHSKTDVTLITRPRRFGKTLTLSMLECFFSNRYANRKELFEKLDIWKHTAMRELQGAYPVIFLSFADVRGSDFQSAMRSIDFTFHKLANENRELLDLVEKESMHYTFLKRLLDMKDPEHGVNAIALMSEIMLQVYGKRPLILLDEYDTPLQEAYLHGYYDEMAVFIKALFQIAFKTNTCFEKALITGITRISRESLFSGLNNIEIISTTSVKYATVFGFTESEVFQAMDARGLTEKEAVQRWYDGFCFGNHSGIYNPWSITNYLEYREFRTYWTNTGSYDLISRIVAGSGNDLKQDFQILLSGGHIRKQINEQLSFHYLSSNEDAIWMFLLATGYLTSKPIAVCGGITCDLSITNLETLTMFREMFHGWFLEQLPVYNGFVRGLLSGDAEEMEGYLGRLLCTTISYFDTTESFYHGLVLGLLVDLKDRYRIRSNRESGYGRYDIMMEPLCDTDPAVILEFKLHNRRYEKDIEATAARALLQIQEKGYSAELEALGIPSERILCYGIAFQGKEVWIKK